MPVSAGFYSIGGDPFTHPRQTPCEPGFYCSRGERLTCRRGTYGSGYGLSADWESLGKTTVETTSVDGDHLEEKHGVGDAETAFWCDGFCSKGHFCPEGSTSSTQVPCPAGTYGGEIGLGQPACSGLCKPGHYCPAGSVSAYEVECPAGTFGNASGLTSAACSHDCQGTPSYARYAPRVSNAVVEAPTTTSHGPGGLHHCRPSVCAEGYYCPNASITPKQRECGGHNVYCPWGSSEPVPVTPGYYTTGGTSPQTKTAELQCPPGTYCVGGVKRNCRAGTYGSTAGLTSSACSGKCSPGHYCPEASTSPTEVRCPPGRFGSADGLRSSGCSGRCEPGYYCPEASTRATMEYCGGDAVYCPAGSGKPVNAKPGFFTVSGRRGVVVALLLISLCSFLVFEKK